MQKTLVQRLVDAHPIAEEGNTAGVVVYSSDAEMSIPSNTKSSHDVFKKMVRAMPHTRQQPSNIAKALETTERLLEPSMQKELPKIIVVLNGNGDQDSIYPGAIASNLRSLRAKNVHIILVSFGKAEPSKNLREIADSSANMFHTFDANKLLEAEFISPLAARICQLGEYCKN